MKNFMWRIAPALIIVSMFLGYHAMGAVDLSVEDDASPPLLSGQELADNIAEELVDLSNRITAFVLAGDVDGAAGSNDLDEVAVESEIESVADLADLQGDLPLGTKTSGNYAAGDAEAGAALTGDSATGFFGAGTFEDARVDGTLEEDELEPALDTLDNVTSVQGRTVTLTDDGLDVLFGWDESDNAYESLALAEISTEAAPANGDFVLVYGAEGDLRKVDWAGLPGAGAGLAAADIDTSAEIAAIVGDETGSGALVFATSPTLTTPEIGNADTTLSRTGAGAIAVEGIGVALNSTSLAHTASQFEVGAASDTTLARSGAGAVTIEGVGVALNSTSLAHTASQFEIGAASDTTLTRTGAGAAAIEGVNIALNSTSLSHTASTIELGHASDTTLARSAAGVITVEGLKLSHLENFCFAASDETTTITTGDNKVTVNIPYAFTLTNVYAYVNTVSSSGLPTIDINEDPDAEGASAEASILSTKITIDANERRSSSAATPPVISDTSLAAHSELSIDQDVAGTGAKGVKVCLVGYQT